MIQMKSHRTSKERRERKPRVFSHLCDAAGLRKPPRAFPVWALASGRLRGAEQRKEAQLQESDRCDLG